MLAYGRAIALDLETPAAAGAPPGAGDRLFVLEALHGDAAYVRAFSDGLIEIFGRDLRRSDFKGFFSAPDRAMLDALIQAASAAAAPGVARGVADTEQGGRIGFELMISPLSLRLGGRGRHLGYFQPLGGEVMAPGDMIIRLRLGAVLIPFSRPARTLRLVVNKPE